VRFGRPLSFGYDDVGFTPPLLNGLGGLLFEPTKGVLLFLVVVFTGRKVRAVLEDVRRLDRLSPGSPA
jgi:hypothetical protein